ncbi:MAG: PKD domain-containing protein [bacterium]|nr:PKD domain-containing protein [bacterium]
MKMRKERLLTIAFFAVLALSFTVFPSLLMAWETPMALASGGGSKFYKPEIGFAPSGAVFVVYREKGSVGNSDIMMARYDGKEVTHENVSNTVTLWPKYKCYEPDIEITADGVIHVIWVTHDRNVVDTHFVKYRYKDGNTWSDVINLGTLHMHEDDVVFDMRLGVDNNHNVHVILQEEHQVVVRYFAKFGDTILPMENIGNGGSRLKHPDIAVDDNTVHMIWMRKIGFPYVIMHQKRENRLGGTKSEIRQVTFPIGTYASQKSRIDLSTDGRLHLAEWYKTGIVKKLKYWEENTNGTFKSYVNLSHPDKLQLYHWAGLEVRDDSIIGTMQLGSTSGGSGVYYNWKRNGQWGGYSKIPNTVSPVHTSVDLSADGQVAAVTYGKTSSAVMLVSSEEITALGTLETEFTRPPKVFWGSEITFDASNSVALNPDVNIVSYLWDFGDGSIQTTSGPVVTHNFTNFGVTMQVTLTITSETGESGIYVEEVMIDALYSGIISSIVPRTIRSYFFNRPANEVSWNANPKNVAAGYPSITGFEIWRARTTGFPTDDQYVLIGEVGSGVTTFLDYRGLEANGHYVYSIVSVDSEGHRSPYNHQ